MSAKAVGYVIRMFPQTSETFIANEILELERQGAQVRIFSYRRQRSQVRHECVRLIQAPLTYLPDPVYRHLGRIVRAHRELLRRNPARYRMTARYVLSHTLSDRNPDTWRRFLQAGYLARLLLDGDVGHLHAHFAHGATRVAELASMLTGIPFSFTAHARDVYSDDVDFALLREKAERARFAVTVSNYNREFLSERLGHLKSHIRTIYNGVDLDKFVPDPDVKREAGYILAVGRLVEKKGFRHLIDACAILRDRGHRFRCDIVGGGELRDELAARIGAHRLGDVVSLVGTRSQEEILPFYRRANLVVMSAVLAGDGNRDALPTVLLEAMACGTPVVASRLTGIPEIVDDGKNGLLIEPGNAKLLSEALERLLLQPELCLRFGLAARAKAERCFDLHRNVGRLHNLFDESLGIQGARDDGAHRLSVL
jgi:colanic acid/amylovoran biosynthesis glycosyltransferase